MKGTAKALAYAQESASALALDEQEHIEPVIVVPEGNVLTRVSYADTLNTEVARELFIVDKQTFTSSQSSNKGIFRRLRNAFSRRNHSIHMDEMTTRGRIVALLLITLPMPLAVTAIALGANDALSFGVAVFPALCFLAPELIRAFGRKSFNKASKNTREKLKSWGSKQFNSFIWEQFDGSRFSIGKPSLASLTQAINEIEELNETHLTKLREFEENAQLFSASTGDNELYEKMIAERPLFESMLREYNQRVLEIQEILSREEV